VHAVFNEVDGVFDLGQELQSIILDASNLANSRSARVFSARYSQQAENDSRDFAEIALATRTFILETEVMAGQMLTPLRAALTNQASPKFKMLLAWRDFPADNCRLHRHVLSLRPIIPNVYRRPQSSSKKNSGYRARSQREFVARLTG
jgi:hypothetical protein